MRELYSEVAKAKVGLYGDLDSRVLPFAWGQLDASVSGAVFSKFNQSINQAINHLSALASPS